MSQLIDAILNNDIDAVDQILAGGYNANTKFTGFLSSLALACACGYTEIVKLLLDNGANTNDHGTALNQACTAGHTEVVKLLLVKGINVNAKNVNDGYGWSALHSACHHDHKEIVKLLLTYGANIDDLNNDGEVPYNMTINPEIHMLLKSKGFDAPKTIIEYLEENDFIKVFEICNINVMYQI